MNAKIEEADLRTVLHAFHATKGGSKLLVILSQDTDVLILFLYHWMELNALGLEQLWITAAATDTSTYIPINNLAVQLGQGLCRVLLTGCDYSSKFGTKLTSLKADPKVYLQKMCVE